MRAGDLLLSTWPIVRREFVGLLRTRKAFWIAVLTVAAASLFPLLAWPEPGNPMPYAASMLAYGFYFQALAFALFLFVPAVAAGAISGERERDTYDLLYHTLIRPPGIVIGKLIATGGYFLLLLALTSPMVCVLYLLGGFQVRDFLTALGITSLGILFLSLAGLWSSMRSRRTYRALIGAFVILIGLYVVTGVGAWLWLLVAFSQGGGPPNQTAMLIAFLVYLALLCLFFFLSLLRRARFPDPPSSRRQELRVHKTAQLRGAEVKPRRSWLTAVVLDPARQGIPDGWNPVLVNSLRSEASGSRSSRRKLFWGFAVLLALIMGACLVAHQRYFKLSFPLMVNTHLLLYSIALITAASSAASLAGERELGKLDFLRSTLLTPWRILWGKLWACLFGISGLPILGAIFCGFILFISSLDPRPGGDELLPSFGSRMEVSMAFLASAAAVMLSCATWGLLAATLSRTTVAAAVLSYVLSAANLLIIPLLMVIPVDDGKLTATLSPLLAYSICGVDSDPEKWAIFRGSLGVSLCVSGVVFVLALAIFHRRWMRDP